MPRPQRSEQFSDSEVCVLHVVQRCVRKAWLAGVDKESGKDYSFRKEWIRRRMEALASVFAIDVLSYAILSNHIHQILRNRPDVVSKWSDEEVAIREERKNGRCHAPNTCSRDGHRVYFSPLNTSPGEI